MLKKAFVFGACLVVTSCTTKEFNQTEAVCTSIWMEKIPPVYEKEIYNKLYIREVPTGETICTTTGEGYSSKTKCKQEMKKEEYTLPAVRTVDKNQRKRNRNIGACTREKCTEKYGNAKCEP